MSRNSVGHLIRRRIWNWRFVLVLAAVSSLTLNVATRYSFAADSQAAVIAKCATSHSQYQTRQRLNKTATVPVVPVSRLLRLLEVPDFYPRFAPGGPPVQTLFLNKSLYNRPPPSFDRLS
jgi:hypothetical protein